MPISDAVVALERDLRDIFGSRLQSVVVYATANARAGAPAQTLAVVTDLTVDDLRACAGRVPTWRDAGLATPLVLEGREFERSLDAFPFEFGAILADHAVVSGSDPFAGLRVDPADLRRACEIQARSHVLHLREGYMETEGRGDGLANLITRSSPALAALLRNVSLLEIAEPVSAVLTRVADLGPRGTLSSPDAREVFPEYLRAVEHLTDAIDRWSRQ